jgi:hypothetical protein
MKRLGMAVGGASVPILLLSTLGFIGQLGAALAAVVGLPTALVVAARVAGMEPRRDGVPWRSLSLGTLAVGLVAMLAARWINALVLAPDYRGFGVPIEVLMGLGEVGLVAAVARKQTGRWSPLALSWILPSMAAWAYMSSSTTASDVLGVTDWRMFRLIAVWLTALVFGYVLWAWPAWRAAQQAVAAAGILPRYAPSRARG